MHSYNTPINAQPDAYPDFHPVLRPMRGTVDRIFERGDYERAFPLLRAVIILNGKPAFWQPAAHEHFTGDETGQGGQL